MYFKDQSNFKKYKPILFLSIQPKYLRILDYKNRGLEKIFRNINYNFYSIDGTVPKELLLSEYMLIPR